jgi:hypothetical protein
VSVERELVSLTIYAKAVIRVIIEGEWIWVERGTFTVIPFELMDELGNKVGSAKEPAYFFVSTNGDPYFGPLSRISLMKLDNQILEESGTAPSTYVRSNELPAASEVGPRPEPVATGPAEAGEVTAPEGKKAVPLFADDVDHDAADTSPPSGVEPAGDRRRGGLF